MFILLDTKPVPTDPQVDRVFAFLKDPEAGQNARFVFAVLVHRQNTLLSKFFHELGFVRSSLNVVGQDVTSAQRTWVDWAYWVAPFVDDDKPWPFKGWLGTGTGDESLEHYLALTLPTPTAGDTFVIPTALAPTGVPILSPQMVQKTAKHPWLGVEFLKDGNGDPEGWEFRFAGTLTGGGGTGVGVSLLVPSITKAHTHASIPDLPSRRLDLRLVAQAELTTTCSGATVHLGDDVPICGTGSAPTLELDGGIVLRGVNLDANDLSLGVLFYEYEPRIALKFGLDPLGAGSNLSGVVRFTVRSNALYVRHSKTALSLCRFSPLIPQPVSLTIKVEAPLMDMAGEAVADLPLVVSTKDAITNALDGELEKLSWSFRVALPPEFFTEDGDPATFGTLLSSDSAGRSWKLSSRLIEHAKTLGNFDSGLTSLSGWLFDLSEFLGEKAGTTFQISRAPVVASLLQPMNFKDVVIPVQLHVVIAERPVTFILFFAFELGSFRLKSDKLFFLFPPAIEGDSVQVIDLELFAIILPSFTQPKDLSKALSDGKLEEISSGFLDFKNQRFVLKPLSGAGASEIPGPLLIFPGHLESTQLHKRITLKLTAFDPDTWPREGKNNVYLRIHEKGISFKAIIEKSASTTVMDGNPGIGAKDISIQTVAERKGTKSELVVIDNRIRSAVLMADFDVPAVKDLRAEVTLGIRQERVGKPPIVFAVFDLEKLNGKAIADFSVGYLRLAIEDIRLHLQWDTGTFDWNVKAFVDGSISLADSVTSTGKLDSLKKKDAIIVRDFNLLDANNGAGSIGLKLADPVEFKCLDELFLVRFHDLEFEWGKEFVLRCSLAELQFTKPSAFEVAIEVGALTLRFAGGSKVKLETPSTIGLQVKIGSTALYAGKIGYVDNEKERYFLAQGMLAIEGLPQAKTLLKLGSGRKRNGQLVPNVVFYGAIEKEIDIMSGVVVKELGAGVGINNRLAAIGEFPNADQILARIDDVEPDRITSWEFVERNGFFLSVVGSAIIASTKGGPDVQNAYIASLVLSVDSDLHVVAAGKLWLSCSLSFVRTADHWQRPAMIGALVLLLREQYLSIALESKHNPAIESNDQLKKIFDKGKVRMTFVLSPALVDYHLEEVSYKDTFFGVPMNFFGTFRVAIFRETVLIKAGLSVDGHYRKELSGGAGGFLFYGEFTLDIEFGGLLQLQDIDVYGMIDSKLFFEVEAYISIRYPKSVSWKGIKWGTKNISSGRKRIDLGFDGAFAISSKGGFGFAGSVSISIPISRWNLNISPSLDINGDLVGIVRDRVSAFERQLDQFKEELLAPPPSARNLGAAAADQIQFEPQERWFRTHHLHEEEKVDRVLLLPAPEAIWFTPEVDDPLGENAPADHAAFKKHVVKIEFFNPDEPATIVLTLWLPWSRHKDLLELIEKAEREKKLRVFTGEVIREASGEELREACGEMESLLVETAITDPTMLAKFLLYQSNLDPAEFLVVSDPLVERTDREFFTETDRATLPSDILPVKTRTVEEMLQSGVAAASEPDLLKSAEYAFYLERAGRELALHGSDSSEFESLEQQRALVAQLAKNRLDGLDDFPATRTFVLDSSGRVQVGLVAIRTGDLTAGELESAQFRIYRETENQQLNKVFDSSTSVDKFNALGAFSVESSKNGDSFERCYHPLPIRQDFIQDDQSGSASRGRVRVHLPIKLDDELLTRSDLHPVGIQIWRRLPRQSNWTRLADEQFPALMRTTDPVTGKTVIVVRPYLFVDEFKTETVTVGNRRINRLQNFEMQDRTNRVSYRYKMVIPGLRTDPTIAGTKPFGSVRLHVPQQTVFPFGVACVLDVHSLRIPSSASANHKIRFRLFRFGGETGELSPLTLSPPESIDPVFPDVDDFEIYAERVSIGESGFMGRDAERFEAHIVESAKVDQLRQRRKFKSTEGRVRLKVEKTDDKDVRSFTLEVSDFLRAGFGYRLLIRPTEQFDHSLLTETSCFLARNLAGNEQSKLQTKPISHFELIPELIWDNVKAGKEANGIQDFSALGVAANPNQPDAWSNDLVLLRNSIRVLWKETDPLAGGAELVFQDADDGAVGHRQLCEAVRVDRFRQRIQQFDDDSQWRFTSSERANRITFGHVGTELGPIGDLSDYFVLKDTAANPLFRALFTASVRLSLFLKQDDWEWQEYLLRTRVLKAALRDYERSSAAVHSVEYQRLRKLIDGLLRQTFWGAIVRPDQASISKYENDLVELCKSVETPNSIDVTQEDVDDVATRAKQLDETLAKRFVGVIRRRMKIAAEIDGVGPINAALLRPGESKDSLPGAKIWRTAVNARNQFLRRIPNATFPISDLILSMVETPVEQERPRLASDVGKIVLELEKLVTNDHFKSSEIVTKAAALTRLTNWLEAHYASQGGRLLKRPHHQVTVVTNDLGVRVAQPGDVTDYFAREFSSEVPKGDWDINHTGSAALETYSVPLLNLLERMGFALDIAAVDAQQEPVSPRKLQETINDAIRQINGPLVTGSVPSQPLEHAIWIVSGYETDSEITEIGKTRIDSVGVGVVKLIVMPKPFAQALMAEKIDPTNLNGLLVWFGARGLSLGSTPEVRTLLERLSGLARFVFCPIKKLDALPVALPSDVNPATIAPIRLELAGQRWRTVPADAYVSHSRWICPDQAGRRFKVRVRKVSRYEPLIRWAEVNYELFNVSNLPFEQIQFEPMVSLDDDPRLDSQRQITVIPNERDVNFVFSPQPHATRSLLNNISAVRSGAAGHNLYFSYEIPSTIKYLKYWEAMRDLTVAPSPPGLPYRQELTVPPSKEIQLFSHERMISVSRLAFFYHYQAIAASHSHVRFLNPEKAKSVDWKETAIAKREPSAFAAYPALIDFDDATKTATIELTIPTLGDLLNPDERHASPEHLLIEGLDVTADQLPDLSLSFQLLERLAPSDPNAKPHLGLYSVLGEVFLPLADGYQEQGDDSLKHRAMFANRQPGLILIPNGFERAPIDRHVQRDGMVVTVSYRLTVSFTVKDVQSPLFSDPEQRLIRVRRKGHNSTPLPILEKGSSS